MRSQRAKIFWSSTEFLASTPVWKGVKGLHNLTVHPNLKKLYFFSFHFNCTCPAVRNKLYENKMTLNRLKVEQAAVDIDFERLSKLPLRPPGSKTLS